jgi:hypothetical protein
MRKLPIGPLFVLLVIFLVSHFASAQSLPTTLPAKLPAKLPSKRAGVRSAPTAETKSEAGPVTGSVKTTVTVTKTPKANLKAKAQSGKSATKSAASSVAKAAAKKNAVAGMPKSLPAFKGSKRVQLNFEEIPSTPLEQSVVVMSPALEAQTDSDAIAAASIDALPQALPVKPPQAPRPPEFATVERPLIEVLPAEPTGELWQQNPSAVAAQPLREEGASSESKDLVGSTTFADSTASAEASSAALVPLKDDADITATESAFTTSASSTEAAAGSTGATSAAASSATAASSASASTSAPSTTTSVTASTAVISTAGLSAQPVEVSSETNSMTARIETSRDRNDLRSNKIFVRTGYLAARYSELESELKNGATTFGLSYAHGFNAWELKASLDLAYGLDQQMNFRNTRMALVRAEGLYLFNSFGILRPIVGAGIGFANIDVTSYRESSGSSDLIVREHAQGTAFLISPQAGLRAQFSNSVLFDLTGQYLVLAGGENLSKLGGALVEASLGFAF